MENLPKHNIFQTPEDYFQKLPETIFQKQKAKKAEFRIWTISAAAAVLVIGLIFVPFQQYKINQPNFEASVIEEIDFYIESGYFQAEDILSLSEDPDDILDEIISKEWNYDLERDNEEDWWF